MPPYKELMVSTLFATLLFSYQYITPVLTVTLDTNKQLYNVGEEVEISGSLFYEWVPDFPVADIVTLQVNYPSPHGLCMLRTLPTGSLEGKEWIIEILEVLPCDSGGNPKDSFKRGTLAYFMVKWRNYDSLPHYVMLTLTLYYSNDSPFKAYCPIAGDLTANETRTGLFSVPIPANALTGPAKIYASAISNWPKNNGSAYCPEKSADFSITSSSSFGASAQNNGEKSFSTQGDYNVSFWTLTQGAFIGNYTIYATSRLLGTKQATNTTTLEVILLGDVNEDYVVDVVDFQLVKIAIPSTPSSPNWNPKADLNRDDVVDATDYVIVKSNVGHYASS